MVPGQRIPSVPHRLTDGLDSALQLVTRLRDVGLTDVVVSVGGGGLIARIAAALHARRPGVRVWGVETEGASDGPAPSGCCDFTLGNPQAERPPGALIPNSQTLPKI
jgi:hypothetical protein